jgi:hypothetical protein
MTNTTHAYPNNISAFIHCGECLKELPKDTSPRDWSHNEIGWTKEGLEVWCIRHEMVVIALDFLGRKVERLA